MKNDLFAFIMFVIYCVALLVTAFLCELWLLDDFSFLPRRTSGSFRELYKDNAEALKKDNDESSKGGDLK